MPLYEYQCNTCGQAFERMLRFSEADQRPVCPVCQSPDTRKKVTAAASLGGASSGSSPASAAGCGSSGRFR